MKVHDNMHSKAILVKVGEHDKVILGRCSNVILVKVGEHDKRHFRLKAENTTYRCSKVFLEYMTVGE